MKHITDRAEAFALIRQAIAWDYGYRESEPGFAPFETFKLMLESGEAVTFERDLLSDEEAAEMKAAVRPAFNYDFS